MADPRVEAVAAKVARALERTTKAMALNVHSALVEATPVDTGWARANWVPSVSAPVGGVVGTPEPKVGEGPAPQSSAMAEVNAGKTAVAAFKLGDGKAFISNHVPYIRRLNNGHSKQAPTDFVGRAVAEGTAKTRQALRRGAR